MPRFGKNVLSQYLRTKCDKQLRLSLYAPNVWTQSKFSYHDYTAPRVRWLPYFASVTGPIMNSVLPDGSSKSNVRAPHSSSFGGRKMSTLDFHSR